jgi:Fe-S cluster assembly protein SufD
MATVEAPEATLSKAHYLADLAQARPSEAPEWAGRIRQSNEERFAALPFPHRKQEDWRRTNVKPIVRHPFRSPVEPHGQNVPSKEIERVLYSQPGWVELVFVDGFFDASLSRLMPPPEDVRVGSLAHAIQADDEIVARHLDGPARTTGAQDNIFAALNSAFLLDGAFVHVPPQTTVPSPVHLVFVSTGGSGQAALHPRNLIVVEAQSEVTVVETYTSLGDDAACFTNAVTEVHVGEGATLHSCRVQTESTQGYHLSKTAVHQERDSTFESWSVASGGRIARHELAVTLGGEGAACRLRKLTMARDRQLIDHAAVIDHASPNCSSWIGAKAILDDASSGVFSGKVLVRRDSQKTDSNQLNNTLLLSPKATMDTKPVLEIFADDVKCTHGATVGRPPEEILFYFRSRGIDESVARAMLTCGFAGEFTAAIDVPAVRERLDRMVYKRYNPDRTTGREHGSTHGPKGA